MRHHFEHNINIKDLILTYRPATILELGALRGENTVQILGLREVYPFKMVTISDGPVSDAFSEVRQAVSLGDYEWKQGLSYERIPELKDSSIECALIDTDHNYFIMTKELEALYPKLFARTIIVMHDTVSCLSQGQRAVGYGDENYQRSVDECTAQGLTMNNAIDKFMERDHPNEWDILRMSREDAGCLAISRAVKIGWME